MELLNLQPSPVQNWAKGNQTLREQGLIPVVLNGGAIVELPYNGTLKAGEKIVEIGNGKGLITTDLVATNEAVRKLVYTPDIFAVELDINGEKRMAQSSKIFSSTP